MTRTAATVTFKNANYAAELTTLCNGQQSATFQGPRGAQLLLIVRADGRAGEVVTLAMNTVGTASLLA
jgi:hypothetical protein